MTALTFFLKRAWLRREHRLDIARINDLHAQLDALRGEEQLAILTALDSGRRLRELEAQEGEIGAPA